MRSPSANSCLPTLCLFVCILALGYAATNTTGKHEVNAIRTATKANSKLKNAFHLLDDSPDSDESSEEGPTIAEERQASNARNSSKVLCNTDQCRTPSTLRTPKKHRKSNVTTVHPEDVCQTDACTALSASMNESIGEDEDPCEDFFEYACKHWIKEHKSPSGHVTWSQSDELQIDIASQVYQLLQEEEKPKDSDAVKAAKQQYVVCRNQTELDTFGFEPLLKVVEENGGWPMLIGKQFNATKGWQEVQDFYNRVTGNGPLYNVFVNTRGGNLPQNIITLEQPTEFPTKSPFLPNQRLTKEYAFFISLAVSLISNHSSFDNGMAAIIDDAVEVQAFAEKLERIRITKAFKMSSDLLNLTRADEKINDDTNATIDFLAALETTFRDVPHAPFNESVEINIRHLNYFRSLLHLIEETSTRTLLNYMHFQFVEQFLLYTTSGIIELYTEGLELPPLNRTEFCAQVPNTKKIFNSMYLRRHVPEHKRALAKRVVDDIKHDIEVQINRTSFLDNSTRAMALAKLEHLSLVVGYDDSYANETELDLSYNEFNMSRNLLQNMVNYKAVENKRSLMKLLDSGGPEALRRRSIRDPLETSPMYNIMENRLEIPATLLNSPLLDADLPNLTNYAAFGSIVGALLSQLYIHFGMQFNDQGKLQAWVSESAAEAFEKRSECYSNQYSRTSIPELDNAGIEYDTSELVDYPVLAEYHFGLKAAYRAYKARVKKDSVKVLPNLTDFSAEEQFFLSFATAQCEKVRPKLLAEKLENDIITTGRVKVNSALQNLREFGKAFKCKRKSTMNPKTKCNWFD